MFKLVRKNLLEKMMIVLFCLGLKLNMNTTSYTRNWTRKSIAVSYVDSNINTTWNELIYGSFGSAFKIDFGFESI